MMPSHVLKVIGTVPANTEVLSDIDGMLQQSLMDGKLSRPETSVLREILITEAVTQHQRDLLRHRAFEIARQSLLGPDASDMMAVSCEDFRKAVHLPLLTPDEMMPEITCLRKQFLNRGDRY